MLEILQAAGAALGELFEPARLLYLFSGVVVGLILGAIPGIGGLIAIAILLPFTFTMDSAAAIALIMGIAAVGTISDTIPAVLFAVPGTTGSQATVLDGYPLARQGQAGRALGAAYFSNVLGGLIGALALMVAALALRPVVRAIGSPEVFALGVLGVSMVGVLSSGAMLRGLTMGFVGLALSTIGLGEGAGTPRYTFGHLYLWDGLSIIGVTLGLFGLVEIADLVIQRSGIARGGQQVSLSPLEGMKDVLRHKFLLVRSSLLGVFFGAVPGIGTTVIDWLAYGHAVQTERDREKFGRGDIRGVIAPEAANNAKEGGQAIPSLAFGVPGGLVWALVITALMIQGIRPGPQLFTDRLDVVFTIGWSIALANVLGVTIVLLMTPVFARISLVPAQVLAPIAVAIITLATFQVSSSWGDLLLVLVFFVVGWILKRTGWPRPPLLIGLVLGSIVERFGITTFGRFGLEAFTRPGVIIILLIMVILLAVSIRRSPGRAVASEGVEESER